LKEGKSRRDSSSGGGGRWGGLLDDIAGSLKRGREGFLTEEGEEGGWGGVHLLNVGSKEAVCRGGIGEESH